MTTKLAKDIGLPPVPEGYFYRIGSCPKMDGYNGGRWVRVQICKPRKFLGFDWAKVVASDSDRVWDDDGPQRAVIGAANDAMKLFLFDKDAKHPAVEYFGDFA